MALKEYRGWTYDTFEEYVHVGYKTPTGRPGKGRKCKAVVAHYPDSDGSKVFESLTEMRRYIDWYTGHHPY